MTDSWPDNWKELFGKVCGKNLWIIIWRNGISFPLKVLSVLEDKTMISLEEAQLKVISQIHPLQSFERVSLKEAVGRVLSETIYAALDQPPFTNSAMDGFAM